MKKIFLSFLLLPFLFISSTSSRVVFLPNAPESVGRVPQGVQRCVTLGYTQTAETCTDGVLEEACPYQSGYYKYCREN
ncbi:MAG: hypothetical protein J5895_01680 [Alphaproteobacteria bacterium]|nr:hypothetical protein [Alphaproteobacteria bacterium]